MKMTTRGATVLTTVALMTTTAPAWCDVRSPEEELIDRVLPEIESSENLATDTLVSGRLEAAQPPTGGSLADVPVVLYVWPSGEELGRMRKGDAVEILPVAKALTDAQGNFELKAEDSRVLEALSDSESGAVNLEVVVPTADGSDSQFLTDIVEFQGEDYTVPGEAEAFDADGASNGYSSEEPEISLEVGEPLTVQEVVASEEKSEDLTKNGCLTKMHRDLGKRGTLVGRTWSKNSRAKMSFTFKTGRDGSRSWGVTLGVAVKKGSGAFKASGTVTEYFSATTPYDTVVGAKSMGYKKNTTYYMYKVTCRSGGQVPVSSTSYKVLPVAMSGSWTIPLSASSMPATSSAKCDNYHNGRLDVDSGKNTTFSSGVELSASIGVNLSAQAGYNSGTKVTVNSTDGKSLTICGSYGLPEKPSTGDIIVR